MQNYKGKIVYVERKSSESDYGSGEYVIFEQSPNNLFGIPTDGGMCGHYDTRTINLISEKEGYNIVNSYDNQEFIKRMVQAIRNLAAKINDPMKSWGDAVYIRAAEVALKLEALIDDNDSDAKLNPKIENNFNYHTPKDGQPEKYDTIRSKAKELAYVIEELCPNGREKSMAMFELETAVFWANASVARN